MPRARIHFVRSRFIRAIVVLILLTCFLCPVLEMLDRWDNTLQTGQDTESTFVVIAVCAGAIISFAFSTTASDIPEDPKMTQIYGSFNPPCDSLIAAREFTAVSQPPPPLRI